MRLHPTLLIDTREQTPLEFLNLPSEVTTLDTGDYSVKGLEHLVCIERKSLPDLLGCVGRDRERFERELARMRGFRFRHLIVEASAEEIEAGDWQSKIVPASVIGTLCAWAARYEISVWFCATHNAAGRWAERLLYQCARQVAKELEACAAFAGDAMTPRPRKARTRALKALPLHPEHREQAVNA